MNETDIEQIVDEKGGGNNLLEKAEYYNCVRVTRFSNNLNDILFSDSGGSQCSLWTQTQRVLQEPDVQQTWWTWGDAAGDDGIQGKPAIFTWKLVEF